MAVWTFPGADDLRLDAARAEDIVDEIRAIEKALIAAADSNRFETTVEGTVMASDSTYYDVWAGNATDAVREHAMESVIRYFESRGYVVVREQHPINSNQFRWRLSW